MLSWAAFNALYPRQTAGASSEARAFHRWLKMRPASEAFPSLCRSQGP